MPKTTSRAKAEAHEALYLRLSALHDQVAGVAARHPRAAVAPETRAIAEAVLFDSRPFTPAASPLPRAGESLPPAGSGGGTAEARGRDPQGRVGARGFPAAADSCAALASQLGQARAALEMWEAIHSHWNGECFVWRLNRNEDPLPIQRLRAKTQFAGRDPEERRQSDRLREALIKRIEARFDEGYDRGYADARDGRPSRAEERYPRLVAED
jgi:hypothetical protein